VRNGALRQFVEILSAADLAPKTIVNVVTVVKFVVASAVDEEGDQIHPRIWNHEFIQLPLIIKEKQNRPTINEAEISAMLTTMKERDAVLVALVAGTGLRIGEALAIRTDDFDPLCRLLQVRRSVWRRREQAPKTLNAIRPVDIPEPLARVLCRYIKGREGHLFTTRAGVFWTRATSWMCCSKRGDKADTTRSAAFVLRYSARRGCRTTSSNCG
jgi:integrase